MIIASGLRQLSARLESSSNEVGLVPSSTCNDRSLSSIISSCLVTIFACTWIAVHPNIPADGKLFWSHFKTCVLALIAPELIVLWALRQRIATRRLAKQHREFSWTRTHAFFAIMGGFQCSGSESGSAVTIRPERLTPYLKNGDINITKAEIWDKSKGDNFTKSFVLLHVAWFTLHAVVRLLFQNLATTDLELVTLAYAILNFMIYACWWGKPLDVACPIKTTSSAPVDSSGRRLSTDQDVDSMRSSGRQEDGRQSPRTLPHEPEASHWLLINQLLDYWRYYARYLLADGDSHQQEDGPQSSQTSRVELEPLRGSDNISPHGLQNESDTHHQTPMSLSVRRGSTVNESCPGPSLMEAYSSNDTPSLINDNVGHTSIGHSRSTFAMYFLEPAIRRLRRLIRDNFTFRRAGHIIDQILRPFHFLYRGLESLLFRDESSNARKLDGTYFSGTLEDEDIWAERVAAAIAVVFGALHCWAWKFQLPSRSEQILWRVSSVTMTILPLYFFLFAHRILSAHDQRSVVSHTLITLPLLLYIGARVILLVVMFMALRKPDPGIYTSSGWVDKIPHFYF